MKLITTKGEFTSFATLRLAYLRSGEDMKLDPKHTGGDEWDAGKLHASELGYCPRMQLLRILGAPKKVQALATQANEELMFWVGYRVHYLTYEAMKWSGILVAHEWSVLKPPWAGRVDAFFHPDINSPEVWMYDCKTVRPNAIKYAYTYPKEAHCLQIGAYSAALPEFDKGVIEYVDRGGSNPPIECVIGLSEWEQAAEIKMGFLEAHLTLCQGQPWESADLPDILPESFVAHYRKVRNQPMKELVSVTYECSWECGYCDYHHTTPEGVTRKESACHPCNHAPIEVAKKEKGNWTFHPNVADFAKDIEAMGLKGAIDKTGFDEWFAAQQFMVPIVGGEE